MIDFRKHFRIEVALCAVFLNTIGSPIAFADDFEEDIAVAEPAAVEKAENKNIYTINFNNVSIIEFIRFVSKITGLNFVFEDGDLQFNVTIVSEDPVSPRNVMSALAQVLRVHGMTLLEQENNILLVKAKDVNQIPTIISSDLPESAVGRAALVTRVFRLKNANLNSVAAIIRPMISSTALIEVSNETRQLIVTDIVTNVEKIASLLTSLDAPHTSLDIDSYLAKNIAPQDLITLTQQIVAPFAEGNPLIFVPQVDTNSIFIVSTPYLIERAVTVMEDLDVPAKKVVIGQKTNALSNVYVYKIKVANEEQIEEALKQMADNLSSSNTPDEDLIEAIDSMRWIKETNSLVFIGTEKALARITDLLPTFDVSPAFAKTPLSQAAAKSNFLVYNPQYQSGAELEKSMTEISYGLKESGLADPSFIQTIDSMRWVANTNSLIFTGDPQSLERVQGMLKSMDNLEDLSIKTAKSFFLYKLQKAPGDAVLKSLHELSDNLPTTGLANQNLIQSINDTKWIQDNNALLITGSPDSVEQIKTLIAEFDLSTSGEARHISEKSTFFLYKLKYVSADQLINSLKTFANNLQQASVEDKELTQSINTLKWIKESNSILFTGPSDALTRIEVLVQQFDSPTMRGPEKAAVARGAAAFVVYNPKNVSGPELISILCDFEQNLISSGVSDPGLFDTINNLKWIDRTSSLLISGDDASMKKVQDLLTRFDVLGKEGASPSIESIDNTSFLVYKLQYHQGTDIQAALKKIAGSLMKAGSVSSQTSIADAIDSIQWIEVTNSLLCTGQQEILTKLKDLIQSLDIPLRQVFIEVLVIETTMSNTQNFGLQWGSQMQFLNKANLGFGNFPIPQTPTATTPILLNPLSLITATTTPKGGNAAQSVPFTNGFDLGVIGDLIMHKGKSFISLGSLINALQADTDTTIVMNPKLITQDNHQSTIFIGQNIPFSGSLVTNTSGGANVLTSSNVEYRDVGVSLTITPILGNNNTVTLDIINDISEQTGNTTNQAQDLTGLQTTHTHMETKVHVPNDHFVVLSGMINDTRIHYRSAIPCLGGLPVIGAAFSENDRTRQQSNVIIFMRPHIINSFAEYKQITEHQEWLWKDELGKSFMKEEFDHGIDMVKLPENE